MGILSAILRFFGFATEPPKDMLLLVSPLRHSREQMTKASADFMRTMQMQAYQAAEDRIDPEPAEQQHAHH